MTVTDAGGDQVACGDDVFYGDWSYNHGEGHTYSMHSGVVTRIDRDPNDTRVTVLETGTLNYLAMSPTDCKKVSTEYG